MITKIEIWCGAPLQPSVDDSKEFSSESEQHYLAAGQATAPAFTSSAAADDDDDLYS